MTQLSKRKVKMITAKTTSILLLLSFCGNLFAQKETPKSVLFNGKDFAGWQKYLAVPYKSVGIEMPKGENGDYISPIGFDKDPLNVFKVVTEDGKPAIKVTGEVFGHIRTTNEYENYHLIISFKWGNKKYPPREDKKRDAGLLYHSVGVPQNTAPWSQSQECQIQEGDCGDYFIIGGSTIDIKVDTSSKPFFKYKKDGVLTNFLALPRRGRCLKSEDFENPVGSWNTIEIYTIGDKSLHVVNGHLVMALQNSRMRASKGQTMPLTKGKIQLQSEGAEIFYRDILLEPITEFPSKFGILF